eukprot:SAG22_NODE_465_length_10181_cov_6.604444_6_plen_152_part_00
MPGLGKPCRVPCRGCKVQQLPGAAVSCPMWWVQGAAAARTAAGVWVLIRSATATSATATPPSITCSNVQNVIIAMMQIDASDASNHHRIQQLWATNRKQTIVVSNRLGSADAVCHAPASRSCPRPRALIAAVLCKRSGTAKKGRKTQGKVV